MTPLLFALLAATSAVSPTDLLPDFAQRRGAASYEYCGAGRVAQPLQIAGAGNCSGAGTWMYGYAADTGAIIDLMVYYTPAARDAAGGVPQIEALIAQAAAIANTSLANSNLAMEFRVIRTALINYTETGDAGIDLPRLVEPADGWIDSVHAERDQYGADLVCMIVEPLNFGGVAYQAFGLWPEDDGRFCFSLVRRDNLSFETLAHELGHNFGCQHDIANAANDGFFPYSYGYREPGQAWKTVMAYPPGQTILHFSNPEVNYTGGLGNPGPTGVPGNDPNVSCNNALTIANLAFTVANFRPSLLDSTPPARLHVRANAANGGNGASWATAFNNAQDAIHTAVRSRGVVTEIWVAAGTYLPDQGSGDRLRNFRLVNNVTIYGGFAGNETQLNQRDPNANPTILSGDIGLPGNSSDNCYHVLSGVDLDATAVLDGFIIRGGNANADYPHDAGGGIRLGCGSPTIRNCTFTLNSAVVGGAAATDSGSSATFENCRFVENAATYSGGAVFAYDSSLAFHGCTFEDNYAPNSGAFESVFGTGSTLVDCLFSLNTAEWGGALGFYQSSGTISGCEFGNNLSLNGGGAIIAGVGSTPAFDDCLIRDNVAGFGGGVYCHSGSDAQFHLCTWSNNTAEIGGAIYLYDAAPTLTSCLLQSNTADPAGWGSGAALACVAGSEPLLVDCRIEWNHAGCCGGALASFESAPVLLGCEIRGNRAGYGGALWFAAGSGGLVERCRLLGNEADVSGGAAHTTDGATPTYVSSEFSGNRALGWSGGAFWNTSGSAARIFNCTLAGNTAGTTSGGLEDDGASSIVANSIFWGNADSSGMTQAAQIGKFGGAATTIDYSIVQGWNGTLGGTANSGLNPLLIDPDGPNNVVGDGDDDLRIGAGSPAIDSGDNARVPTGQTLDLAGLIRFRNDPTMPNTGSGTPPIVDHGAHEFAPACPADLTGDGLVNQADLAALLSCYNQAGNDCGDANGDGQTNQADLALLLSVYNSACP